MAKRVRASVAVGLVCGAVGALIGVQLSDLAYRATAVVTVGVSGSCPIPIPARRPKLVTNQPDACAEATERVGDEVVLRRQRANVVTFVATGPSSEHAIRLVNKHAEEYARSAGNGLARFDDAIASINSRLAESRAKGEQRSAAFRELAQQRLQLMVVRKQLAEPKPVVQRAVEAATVREHELRNGSMGALAGVVLGLVMTFALALPPRTNGGPR